jgi:hypothetical protein
MRVARKPSSSPRLRQALRRDDDGFSYFLLLKPFPVPAKMVETNRGLIRKIEIAVGDSSVSGPTNAQNRKFPRPFRTCPF